jgi:hypothetical protein
LRNADGVRLTKSGTPDKRAGNYKYLKAYYDKLKADRELEQEQEQESGNKNVGENGGYEAESGGAREGGEEEAMRSIEGGQDGYEELRRCELEASARLARERMENGF